MTTAEEIRSLVDETRRVVDHCDHLLYECSGRVEWGTPDHRPGGSMYVCHFCRPQAEAAIRRHGFEPRFIRTN